MATIELNQEEQEVLRDVLTSYLSDLRMEISATDNHDFREQLKHKEQILKEIQTKLGG